MKSQAVFVLSLIGLCNVVALPSATTDPTVAGSCNDIFCIAEQHPVFHPELNACTCDWIPGLEPGSPVDSRAVPPPESCPLIKCAAGFNPVYHPELESCKCDPETPLPETCPTIRCASGFNPVFHPDTGFCSCEPSGK